MTTLEALAHTRLEEFERPPIGTATTTATTAESGKWPSASSDSTRTGAGLAQAPVSTSARAMGESSWEVGGGGPRGLRESTVIEGVEGEEGRGGEGNGVDGVDGAEGSVHASSSDVSNSFSNNGLNNDRENSNSNRAPSNRERENSNQRGSSRGRSSGTDSGRCVPHTLSILIINSL